MHPILVVGATGTVGASVVDVLLSRGLPVRALSRRSSGHGLPGGVEVVEGSLASPGRALEGVRRAFFVSPHAEDEAAQGRAFVAACEAAGVERIVFSGAYHPTAPGALGRALVHALLGVVGPHYRPKLAVERRVLASSASPIVLLPSNFFQNDEPYEPDIRGGAYPQPLGKKPCNRVDCRDIADAAVRALTDDTVASGAYPLVGPEAFDGEGCAAVWSEALGVPVRYAGDDLARWRASSHGLDGRKLLDFEATYGVLQRWGIATSPRELEATVALLGRPPRAYGAYVRELAARWCTAS